MSVTAQLFMAVSLALTWMLWKTSENVLEAARAPSIDAERDPRRPHR